MTDDSTVTRIAQRARSELHARLHTAITGEAATAGMTLDDEQLQRLIADAAARAGGPLWRRCLAEGAAAELGVALDEAVDHPAVELARELVGAPDWRSPAPSYPAPPSPAASPDPAAPASPADPPDPAAPASEGALRLPAVHLRGIESLSAGERDIELRVFSDGIDVLKRSSGALIGRLPSSEIRELELAHPRRGLAGRRAPELHLVTGSGRASFQLPTLTAEQLREHLEPVLARWRADH